MKLLFATNNRYKLKEIQNIIPAGIEIISLADIGCMEDIPETGNSIDANASEKAFFVYNKYNIDCFADDTGLEIEALKGGPGVYSARYAGEGCCFEDNINKVLFEMRGVSNRKACFRTVISLIIDGKEKQFEGRIDGLILSEKHGHEGFGYDPVFLPDGFDQTFAEMPPDLKNRISHRGLAVQKLVHYFESIDKYKKDILKPAI
ncbi:MAG: non-canonical purine NTP diphosphatase [Bacteroidales bacterium]